MGERRRGQQRNSHLVAGKLCLRLRSRAYLGRRQRE